MTDRPMPRDDERLGAQLQTLGRRLGAPAPGDDFAAAVRERIQAAPPPRTAGWALPPLGQIGTPRWRPSLVAAIVLLLAAVAVAVAVGLSVPGIRILFGPLPTGSPPSTAVAPSPDVSAPLGLSLGIGVAVPLADAAALTGFEPRLPIDPAVGPPDQAFVNAGRLTLVWDAGRGLPPLESPEVGLLLTEFRGAVDPGWFEKVVSEQRNTVDPVRVGDHAGFWVTGDPHWLVYRDADGEFVEESRRPVGDVLIWTDGTLTFRLESALGRDATIALGAALE
jgi:hypothetical protein